LALKNYLHLICGEIFGRGFKMQIYTKYLI
jgi:hypothetical protein